MPVTATPIPMLSDNYSWLLIEGLSGKIGMVDPAEPEAAIEAIEIMFGTLDFIFLTHHHDDHIGGVKALVEKYHPLVVGNAADARRLPKLDIPVMEGYTVAFGAATAEVLAVPGHTNGHIAYYFEEGGVLLPGDTMFSLGCGRLFEGTAEDMFGAFRKFDALPDSTYVCPGHEYTAANAKFALSVDPDNVALKERVEQVTALRAINRPTLPVRLGMERAANPFLRAATAEEFGRLRAAKDIF
jgi:hydroxyacylglutathione hydrolase